jgi:hypothetical protein
MTVKVTKPALNLREKLSELDKPSGIAGQDILKADTPQEVFNYIGAGRRNLIINGAMQVAQRGTQSTGVTGVGYQTVDRFKHWIGSLGTWTIDQSTDAPNNFSNSLKLTCTTADASPTGSDYHILTHYIESQNIQGHGFGTSDAKPFTLSFWVKSNKTGAATVDILQMDNSDRQFSPSYTINSADTWEYKTVTIPADASGVINSDNGGGLSIHFWLNSGGNYSSGTNKTVWGSYLAADRNASNLGVGGAVNDYFAITGVQLEVGSVATPFEHRSYGEELALCKRYYEVLGRGGDWSGDRAYNVSTRIVNLPYWSVEKRADPSVIIYSNYGVANSMSNYSSGAENAVVALSDPSKYSVGRFITLTNTITAPHIGYFVADAEL